MNHIVIDARNRRSSTGRYTDILLDKLQDIDKKNRYTVLVGSDDTWQGRAQNFTPLPAPYKQFSINPLEQVKFSWQLYLLRPSLVHFTMPQQPLFFLGKRVTTVHDLTFLRYPRQKNTNTVVFTITMFLYRLLLAWALRVSKELLVPSQFVANDVAAYRPSTKNKIHVTYEANNVSDNPSSQRLPGVRETFILHVGSPLPHKNIERLVEAFMVLKKSHPDLQLVLPGKKDFYFNKLEEDLKQNQYQKDIIIPGRVSDKELAWLYQNATAYVLPSLSEGFGLPGLEAMAHDCPVVSSNATCLPEIYGDAALYFDPQDTGNMTTTISQLIDDKKLAQKLVARGRKQLKHYSGEKMAKETLTVYSAALKK